MFAFGLTHDANALLPLLAATLVAHGFATIVMKRSIMTEKIARRGYHIYREYGVDPLERHDIGEVMTPADRLVAIDGAATLDAVESQYFGAKQTHRAYPVVQNGRLLGLVDRATLDAQRARAAADTPIAGAFADRAPAVAQAHETCRVVASRLAMLGLERLPVVDDEQSMRITGIVSRSDLINPHSSTSTTNRSANASARSSRPTCATSARARPADPLHRTAPRPRRVRSARLTACARDAARVSRAASHSAASRV